MSQEVKEVKLSILELMFFNNILNKIPSKALAIDKVMKLAKFLKQLESHIKFFEEVKQKLIKEYQIKEIKPGQYNWVGHPKEEEINNKFSELSKSVFEVNFDRFLTEEDIKVIIENQEESSTLNIKEVLTLLELFQLE